MATTAAGVAVGSTMAHGLTSMLGFGGNSHSEVPQQSAPMQEQNFDERRMGGSCEAQAKGKFILSYYLWINFECLQVVFKVSKWLKN